MSRLWGSTASAASAVWAAAAMVPKQVSRSASDSVLKVGQHEVGTNNIDEGSDEDATEEDASEEEEVLRPKTHSADSKAVRMRADGKYQPDPKTARWLAHADKALASLTKVRATFPPGVAGRPK